MTLKIFNDTKNIHNTMLSKEKKIQKHVCIIIHILEHKHTHHSHLQTSHIKCIHILDRKQNFFKSPKCEEGLSLNGMITDKIYILLFTFF